MELTDVEIALIVKVREMRAHHIRSAEIWTELLTVLSAATSANDEGEGEPKPLPE